MGYDIDLQMDHTDRQRFFIGPSLAYRSDTSTTLTLLGNFATTNGYGPQQYVTKNLDIIAGYSHYFDAEIAADTNRLVVGKRLPERSA